APVSSSLIPKFSKPNNFHIKTHKLTVNSKTEDSDTKNKYENTLIKAVYNLNIILVIQLEGVGYFGDKEWFYAESIEGQLQMSGAIQDANKDYNVVSFLHTTASTLSLGCTQILKSPQIESLVDTIFGASSPEQDEALGILKTMSRLLLVLCLIQMDEYENIHIYKTHT
ncbi:hypothetical protein ACJX0J_034202, partial [Zea mays]